jgi:hypothetical protein
MNSMNQISSKLDENITNAMQEMTIKSPIIQKNCSPRCARLGWGSFGMYNSSSFQVSNCTSSGLVGQHQFNDEEPKTPMGKRTLTSPPTTPKKKQNK